MAGVTDTILYSFYKEVCSMKKKLMSLMLAAAMVAGTIVICLVLKVL